LPAGHGSFASARRRRSTGDRLAVATPKPTRLRRRVCCRSPPRVSPSAGSPFARCTRGVVRRTTTIGAPPLWDTRYLRGRYTTPGPGHRNWFAVRQTKPGSAIFRTGEELHLEFDASQAAVEAGMDAAIRGCRRVAGGKDMDLYTRTATPSSRCRESAARRRRGLQRRYTTRDESGRMMASVGGPAVGPRVRRLLIVVMVRRGGAGRELDLPGADHVPRMGRPDRPAPELLLPVHVFWRNLFPRSPDRGDVRGVS